MFAAALASCESTTGVMPVDYERLIVAPTKATCTGWWGGEFDCLQVRTPTAATWTEFTDTIEGFTWEPGYFHEIEVRVLRIPNPPADGSDRYYVLDRLVRKWLPGPVVLGE